MDIKFKKILLGGILVLSFLLAVLPTVWAGPPAQKYGPAVPLPTVGPGGGLQFGYFFPRLNALNNELSSMGLPAIGGTFVVGGTIRYSPDPHWQIGYAGTGWGFHSSGVIDNTFKDVSLTFGSHSLVVVRKFYLDQKWSATLGGGLGYYFADYEKLITSGAYEYGDGQDPSTSPSSISKLSGNCWGGQLMAGVTYVINPIISIGVELGYLKATITNLSQAGHSTPSAPIIDLSGWMIRFGPQLNL